MTRKEHLAYCTICCNRKFSTNKGIICSLTDEIANFDPTCPEFKKDDYAITRNQVVNAGINSQTVADDFTFGLDKIGIKNGFLAGLLLIGLGGAWLIWGLKNGVIFYYAFIVIGFGLIALIIAVINTIKRQQIQRRHYKDSQILDNQ